MTPGTNPATREDGGPAAISVMLVDDHAIVRQGLRAVLQREPEIDVVAEASSVGEALAVLDRVTPTVVLLDLKLSTSSDAEGLDLAREITTRHPQVAVLVLTTFIDDELVAEAIRAGAKGYVVKDVDTGALVGAIHDVSTGESAFDARSASAMVRAMQAPPSAPPTLSTREGEVLDLLAHGLSNPEIGRRLYISETTAKFHVGNILRKLEVSGRAEAVYEATKRGLL
ncbi:two-component system response regulator MnoR [Janibacter alkaliphilus]|uniref:DNA-binding NarL/FixJ family response regulator n=1 Tax=Janibacter alkaliphilus TaxID=1069963 RepID=A0A852XGS0_9MICO|nr:response regulator transcription factor [Janibacter alkaliphilus]NYG37611.1 DNA-binding NarL/FixJ family response regulator [Janibacter alkaliphilus]